MKKVIVATISSALIIILSVTVLVLALIPTNKNDLIYMPLNIYITNENTKDMGSDDGALILRYDHGDAEKIQEIYDLFNKNFGQKLLTAIFNGEINNKLTAGHNDALGAPKKYMTKNYDSKVDYTVAFYYATMHEINYKGNKIEYNLLFFKLSDTDDKSDIEFGVCKEDPTSSDRKLSKEKESIPYEYFYHMKINLKNVYDYINDLPNFKNIEK